MQAMNANASSAEPGVLKEELNSNCQSPTVEGASTSILDLELAPNILTLVPDKTGSSRGVGFATALQRRA